MTPENLLHLFNFIIEFWEDRIDFTEWQKGQVVPVPKSGDLSNPNKWRWLNLMDIGYKVFSSMMCKILFKIIKLHRCSTQFGSSPGFGCQDGRFFIKTALCACHKHNLPTYVACVDLVKEFDTVSQSMMLKILEWYGAPHKLRSAIASMYADLNILLKIRKSKAEMVKKLGVRQGDWMSPVLFLFMTMVFSETLEISRKQLGHKMITFNTRTNSPKDRGTLTGHAPKLSPKAPYPSSSTSHTSTMEIYHLNTRINSQRGCN